MVLETPQPNFPLFVPLLVFGLPYENEHCIATALLVISRMIGEIK